MSTLQLSPTDRQQLQADLQRLRGNQEQPPDASVIIPVNAKNDLQVVLAPLRELTRYKGQHRLEVVLVINNYPPDAPPLAIDEYRAMGVTVVAVPDACCVGEVVIMSARAYGVAEARGDVTIHFDADVRFTNITALLDWYIGRLQANPGVAYTSVGFYDVPRIPSIRVKIMLHHAFRWAKRNLMRIPTTRGSNYAVSRELFLTLYAEHKLHVDMHLGPAARLVHAPVTFSGRRDLVTYTSARKMKAGWRRIVRYFRRRASYNLNALKSIRDKNAASWDGYERESEQRIAEQLAAKPAKKD